MVITFFHHCRPHIDTASFKDDAALHLASNINSYDLTSIWLNVGGLGVLIAPLVFAYWLNTGTRAVPGLLGSPRWTGLACRV